MIVSPDKPSCESMKHNCERKEKQLTIILLIISERYLKDVVASSPFFLVRHNTLQVLGLLFVCRVTLDVLGLFFCRNIRTENILTVNWKNIRQNHTRMPSSSCKALEFSCTKVRRACNCDKSVWNIRTCLHTSRDQKRLAAKPQLAYLCL